MTYYGPKYQYWAVELPYWAVELPYWAVELPSTPFTQLKLYNLHRIPNIRISSPTYNPEQPIFPTLFSMKILLKEYLNPRIRNQTSPNALQKDYQKKTEGCFPKKINLERIAAFTTENLLKSSHTHSSPHSRDDL